MAKTVIENDLEVKGNLVPDSADTRTLGTAEKPWQELFLTGSSLYIGGYPLQLDTDRLVFNANKTLAYTDEVIALEGQVTTLEQTSNASIQAVNQAGHGFELLDAVYYDPHDDQGAFTNDYVWGTTGAVRGAVREDVVGQEPEVSYNSSDGTYYMSAWGGRFNPTNDSEKSLYFLGKTGSGDGELQCIMDATVGSFGYYGSVGLMIKSSTGAVCTVLIGAQYSGPGYTSCYSYGSLETPGGWDSNSISSSILPNDYSDLSNLRMKLQVDGNRIRFFFQKIGTDVDFVEDTVTDNTTTFPEGTWDDYEIGFAINGGAYSTGTYYNTTCTVREIDGSLFQMAIIAPGNSLVVLLKANMLKVLFVKLLMSIILK